MLTCKKSMPRFKMSYDETILAQQEEIDFLKSMISKLLEEEKNEKPRATNSPRRRRKKTKSLSRGFENDKIVDSDTLLELVEKFDNGNRRLSKLEKQLEAIGS